MSKNQQRLLLNVNQTQTHHKYKPLSFRSSAVGKEPESKHFNDLPFENIMIDLR